MSYVMIANAGAGNTERVDEAAAVLDEAGGCRVLWTESPEDVDAAILDDPSSVPVVAGGDGSIHLFANRLAGVGALDRPVGILPMGTGNDLARGLGLPFDPAEAASRIVAGSPHTLPMMRSTDGELAVNNAHAGVGVAAARRGTEWKDRLGSFAYAAGSVVEGLTFEGLDATVLADGEAVHQGPCLAVMVLIGPSAGGGFRPLPDVDVTDPVLDLLVVGAGEGRMALAVSALRGELEEAEGVIRRQARTIEVEAGGEEWELDGEFRSWDGPAAFELVDATWTVLL
jgi:diacylglycerol kinase family enzyme